MEKAEREGEQLFVGEAEGAERCRRAAPAHAPSAVRLQRAGSGWYLLAGWPSPPLPPSTCASAWAVGDQQRSDPWEGGKEEGKSGAEREKTR
eukprot:scaffold274779_cov19-Tisochrysis_lutea.AAC.1